MNVERARRSAPPAPDGRNDAQRRADQVAAFRAELAELARDGVASIDREALAAIESYHDTLLRRLSREFDVDTTAAARRMSRGMQVASLLGAAALVAAVVSFVYRIWGSLPIAGQVTLVTAAPLAGVAGAMVAGRLERTHYVASIFAVVACAGFVLQTVVLGQLFNLRGAAHTLGAWALFAFAVSTPGRYALAFAWGIAATIAYLSALMISASGATWSSFPQRPETLIASAAVVGAASLSWPRPFQSIARPIGLVVLLSAVLVLSSSGTSSLLPADPRTIRVVYQLLAVAAAALVIGAGLRNGWKDAVVIGAGFAVLFMLTRFVDWWWDWMPKYLFFLIIAASALASLWLLRLARRRIEGGAA